MKAIFIPPEDIINLDWEMRDKIYKRLRKLDISLSKKIWGKMIDLHCAPTKDMIISLYDYADAFGFSEEDKKEFGSLDIWYKIKHIVLGPDHFTLWLEHTKLED